MPHFQCTVCPRSSLVRSNFKFTPSKRCICVACWDTLGGVRVIIREGLEARDDNDLLALDHPETKGSGS